jgi:ADP-ribose pyrophosphatase YjhB (NUDIX family)
VRRGDAVLLVRQSAGHSLAGQWTVPWGRLENGESPLAAALREVEEEGCVRAVVDGLLGVQELPEPWLGWIALVYLCSHAAGEPEPRDSETDAARYYTVAEFDALDEPVEPWSRWLVRRVLAGRFTLTAADGSNPLGGHGSFL